MAKKGKNQYDDDDGRVIAPMDVDGMPWYDRKHFADKILGVDKQDDSQSVDYNSLSPQEKKEYRKETRAIIRGVILQFLPYLALFVGAFALVILICWLVWK